MGHIVSPWFGVPSSMVTSLSAAHWPRPRDHPAFPTSTDSDNKWQRRHEQGLIQVVFGNVTGTIDVHFEDITAPPMKRQAATLTPDTYASSRAYGREIREAGVNRLTYPSVRHINGHCIGVFRPQAIGIPHQKRHLKYRLDGARIDRVFDYARDTWISL